MILKLSSILLSTFPLLCAPVFLWYEISVHFDSSAPSVKLFTPNTLESYFPKRNTAYSPGQDMVPDLFSPLLVVMQNTWRTLGAKWIRYLKTIAIVWWTYLLWIHFYFQSIIFNLAKTFITILDLLTILFFEKVL